MPAVFQEPKPEQIRPYAVLQKTLDELKKRWRERAPYNWICSQFKSLRQDLTVRNFFVFGSTSISTLFTGAAHQE